LREEINKNKVYPTISRKLKEQGKVIISFRVLKNGVFENINIQTSSNIKRLDEAALNALYDTKKFRSFDEEITKDYMDFEVPLEFIVLN
jgi:periplasmic protein TonB